MPPPSVVFLRSLASLESTPDFVCTPGTQVSNATQRHVHYSPLYLYLRVCASIYLHFSVPFLLHNLSLSQIGFVVFFVYLATLSNCDCLCHVSVSISIYVSLFVFLSICISLLLILVFCLCLCICSCLYLSRSLTFFLSLSLSLI